MSDLGQKIFCRVIGSNVYGADTAYTNVVGPVTGLLAPANAGGADAPDVTGTATEGEELHCDHGFWTGTEPITYDYAWFQLDTLRPVANRTYLPGDFWSGGTYTKFNSRTWHRALAPMTTFRLLFVNWRGWGEYLASLGTNTLTASIEYPVDTFTQVMFGGSVSTTMTDGDNVLSDAVSVAIAAGETFWVRTYVTGSVGAYKMGTGLGDPVRGDCYEATTTEPDKTMGGVIPAAVDHVYMPSAILAFSLEPCTALVGDSRVYGTQTDPPDGDRGELAPRLGAAGEFYLNLGCPSETAQGFVANHAKRIALANTFCSDVILQFGINDVLFERTDAQLRADLTTIRSYFSGLTVKLSTMPPVATSTDGWTTLEGQTIYLPDRNVERVANNNWRRSVPSGFAGCVEVADAVESARDSGIWKVPGYTLDGAHHTVTSEFAIETYEPPVVTGDVLTDEFGEPLTDELGEELTT